MAFTYSDEYKIHVVKSAGNIRVLKLDNRVIMVKSKSIRDKNGSLIMGILNRCPNCMTRSISDADGILINCFNGDKLICEDRKGNFYYYVRLSLSIFLSRKITRNFSGIKYKTIFI